MSINLSKGQKVDLTKGNPSLKSIMVGLGWDVNAFDSGADFDPDRVSLDYESRAGKIRVFDSGLKAAYSEDEATKVLSEDEITVVIDMNAGQAGATAWGCDLTFDYVKINADYRS